MAGCEGTKKWALENGYNEAQAQLLMEIDEKFEEAIKLNMAGDKEVIAIGQFCSLTFNRYMTR